jgi:hypothetical protein
MSQTFNYGLNLGVGSFNQKWDFSFTDSFNDWREEKTGLTFHIFGELEHGSHFGTKLELGYIRKGYTNDLSWEHNGINYFENEVFKTTYNTITIGISERIILLKSHFRPYLKIGINANKIMDDIKYAGLTVREHESGNAYFYGGPDDPLEWNSITISGIFGIGVSYKQLIFMELEYIPAITKLLDTKSIKVSDRCIGLTAGININQLF